MYIYMKVRLIIKKKLNFRDRHSIANKFKCLSSEIETVCDVLIEDF